jgi:hypothetical protein
MGEYPSASDISNLPALFILESDQCLGLVSHSDGLLHQLGKHHDHPYKALLFEGYHIIRGKQLSSPD